MIIPGDLSFRFSNNLNFSTPKLLLVANLSSLIKILLRSHYQCYTGENIVVAGSSPTSSNMIFD